MSVLCALGRHRPAPMARWNNGYYFSRCQRCGRDLVRTAYEGWHVPRGYRVVWSATPPQGVKTAQLAAEPVGEAISNEAAGSPAPVAAAVSPPVETGETLAPREAAASGLPISEVLNLLRQDEVEAAAAPAPEPSPEESPSPAEPQAEEETSPAEVQLEPIELEAATHALAPDEGVLPEADASADDFMAEEDAEPSKADFWAGGDVADEPQAVIAADTAEPEGKLAAEAPEPATEVAEETEEPVEPGTVSSASSEETEPENVEPENPEAESAEPESQDEVDAAPVDGNTEEVPDAEPAAIAEPSADADLVDAPVEASSALAALPEVQASEEPVAPPATESEAASPSPDATEPRRDKAAWPSAAPTQVRTALVGMEEPGPRLLQTALAVGAIAIVLAIVLFFVFRSGSQPLPAPVDAASSVSPTPAETVPVPAGAATAYVSARLLNCRASPVLGAASVTILPRGQLVRVIAREPGWISVAYEGRQCWVAERYLSAERPL